MINLIQGALIYLLLFLLVGCDDNGQFIEVDGLKTRVWQCWVESNSLIYTPYNDQMGSRRIVNCLDKECACLVLKIKD